MENKLVKNVLQIMNIFVAKINQIKNKIRTYIPSFNLNNNL